MRGILTRILLTACIIVLAGVLIMMLFTDSQKETSSKAQITQLEEEAEPYEEQIREIERELDALKAAIDVKNQTGFAAIAYQVKSEDDFAMIREHSTAYSFVPIIVIDLTDPATPSLIQKTKDEGYEMVFTMSFMDENTKLVNSLTHIDESTDFFLLRADYDNDASLQEVFQAGFQGVIRHNDVTGNGRIESTVLDNGAVCVSYSMIKSKTTDVAYRLYELAESKQCCLFTFDLTQPDFQEEFILEHLDLIQSFIDDGDIRYSNLADMKLTTETNYAVSQMNRQEYEQACLDREDDLEELQQTVRDIYAKWSK